MGFWERLGLEVAGPIVTVVVGSLIIGTFAASITRRAQDRRDARRLRTELLAETAHAASSFFYWRLMPWKYNKWNTEQVAESWVRHQELNWRLQANFQSDQAATAWKQVASTLDMLDRLRRNQPVGMDEAKWIPVSFDLNPPLEPTVSYLEELFRAQFKALADMIMHASLRAPG